MHVNGAVSNNNIITPYLVQDFVSQKYSSRTGSQEIKQLEFFFCQGNLTLVHQHFKFCWVDAQISPFQCFFSRLLIGSTQKSTYPAHNHLWTDRLVYIIICPAFKALDMETFII